MSVSDYIFQLNLSQLEKIGDKFHFRCHICGDSKKSQTKKRAWILPGKGGRYHCFNCGITLPFHTYLKQYHSEVYSLYLKEWIKSQKGSEYHEKTKEDPGIIFDTEKLNLRKLSVLKPDHSAVVLFRERKLPKKWLEYLYYSDNYMKWINSIFEDKCEKYPEKDRRIVIPYYSKHRKIIAVQGRSIEKKTSLRYITIKFNEKAKKVCGLERIDVSKTIPVLEGFFDSVFLPNSISMGGADLDLDYLSTIAPKDKFLFIFDLEPRNKEICSRINKVIDKGFRVCLLPIKLQQYGKDINEMIKNGLTKNVLYSNIHKNTFVDLEAKIKFKLWRKC